MKGELKKEERKKNDTSSCTIVSSQPKITRKIDSMTRKERAELNQLFPRFFIERSEREERILTYAIGVDT